MAVGDIRYRWKNEVDDTASAALRMFIREEEKQIDTELNLRQLEEMRDNQVKAKATAESKITQFEEAIAQVKKDLGIL